MFCEPLDFYIRCSDLLGVLSLMYLIPDLSPENRAPEATLRGSDQAIPFFGTSVH